MAHVSEAERLVALGNELADAGRPSDAEAAYLAAARADPGWSVPWYDLGLLCKYQGRWKESLEFNRRATERDPGDEASWWNLGIAATALADWAQARRAWRACGIQLPAGEGPPEADLGPTPVRLDPDGEGEVVWASRMDPARARLLNVPLPASSFRWGDIVLHDGAAEGYRMLRGTRLSVFNVLARLERSTAPTYVVVLGTTDAAAIDALEQIATELGGAAEHWGATTNILCRKCSLGLPHDHSKRPRTPAHPHCGVAARDATHLRQILDAWLAGTPRAAVVRWERASEGAG